MLPVLACCTALFVCRLHLAASVGNLPVLQLLLARNAKVNARDRWGGTPLRDAVREGHAAAVKVLCDAGGELCYTDDEASSKLCELAKQGSRDLLEILLSCGVPVNAKDYDGRTALHVRDRRALPHQKGRLRLHT